MRFFCKVEFHIELFSIFLVETKYSGRGITSIDYYWPDIRINFSLFTITIIPIILICHAPFCDNILCSSYNVELVLSRPSKRDRACVSMRISVFLFVPVVWRSCRSVRALQDMFTKFQSYFYVETAKKRRFHSQRNLQVLRSLFIVHVCTRYAC